MQEQNKIRRVEVHGFKSHLDSVFEYAPGLTVVTGPSDTGKSAGVMQPIKWVAFGEPAGEDFLFTVRDEDTGEITRQAEQAEVTIETDLATVKKVRRKGKTTWFINDMENPVSEKADVPDEVKAVLGLTLQTYGEFETSLNFAYQLEAPFIISETPSVGAKVLGKLAGTEVVDKAIGSVGKKVYKARDDKSSAQKAIDRTNVELIEYLQLADIEKLVADAEALILIIDQDADKAARIRQLYAQYGVVGEHLEEIQETLAKYAVVPELLQIMAVVTTDMQAADILYPAYIKHHELDEQISQVSDKIRRLEDLPEAIRLLTEIENAYSSHTDIFRLAGEHSAIDYRIDGKMAILESLTGISDASTLLAETEKLSKVRAGITQTLEAYSKLTAALVEKERLLEATQQLKKSQKLLSEIDADSVLLETLKGLLDEFNRKSVLKAEGIERSLQAKEEKETAEVVLSTAWEEAGGRCPLCDQPVDADHNH